jgi:hypothetical protein
MNRSAWPSSAPFTQAEASATPPRRRARRLTDALQHRSVRRVTRVLPSGRRREAGRSYQADQYHHDDRRRSDRCGRVVALDPAGDPRLTAECGRVVHRSSHHGEGGWPLVLESAHVSVLRYVLGELVPIPKSIAHVAGALDRGRSPVPGLTCEAHRRCGRSTACSSQGASSYSGVTSVGCLGMRRLAIGFQDHLQRLEVRGDGGLDP